MTRKKEEEEEKKKKKKKKKQQQHKEEDAQVTSDKITDKMETKEEQEEEEEDAQVTSAKITEKMETKEEQEEEEARRQQAARKMMLAHDFLHLSSNILARPCCYRNELAMMITEEDEQEDERLREAKRHAEMEEREAEMEAERKAERERERLRERSKQRKANREAKRKQMLHKERIVEEEQCIVEHKEPIVEEEHADEQEAKPPKEQLKEWMDNHLGFFAGYRTDWEYSSGSKPGQCGEFEDKTTLSPMQFTHCIPGIIPPRAAVIESTLQIYSFKITGLSDDLKWPLNVYGVIAARDTVDHNRNLLFSRSSIMRQVLTSENDCSLCLTGPSRAILAMDPVDFEVELRVHDGCDPRGDGLNDRELIYVSSRYEVAPSADLVWAVCCVLRLTKYIQGSKATVRL
ncbi:TRAF2 and NCK-interacting protein kinase-like isoform X2 [Hordeum vulgare subsp. vulgare]|uniref:TRAF2 and NCK-interacting protein kinase-like isoform X2 n=1 Tax=Hordeum vulgare subsp. vulgare TaxID=112509 RepID=UPI001D1A4353|nr:TRAF2 and NCK-interacting protein kinase-like isoform X2 [Hordeum vulgare subsp. vulgare]